jgi:hypothetical protein
MCLRRAPEKYITGAALDRAVVEEPAASNLYPEAVGSMFFRNICTDEKGYMVP